MFLNSLFALFLIDAASVASPGPKLLLVTQSSIERGKLQGLLVVLGISTGSFIWSASAMAGLSVFINDNPMVHTVIKYFGIAYILYLGVQVFLLKSDKYSPEKKNVGAKESISSFFRGLTISIINVESIAYFASIFSLFIPKEYSLIESVPFVLIPTLNALFIFGAFSIILSQRQIRDVYFSHSVPINRTFGALMIFIGISMLYGLLFFDQ